MTFTLPIDHPAHRATFTAEQLVAVVPAHVGELTYTDRGFGNASDYSVLRLVPGEYPVRLTDITGADCAPDVTGGDHRSYWVSVTVDAVELRSGGTNRLFNASSAFEREGQGATRKTFRTYAYNAGDGYVMAQTPAPVEGNEWNHEAICILHAR